MRKLNFKTPTILLIILLIILFVVAVISRKKFLGYVYKEIPKDSTVTIITNNGNVYDIDKENLRKKLDTNLLKPKLYQEKTGKEGSDSSETHYKIVVPKI